MGKSVAQLRNDDPARLQRILNEKQRIMGVDIHALQNQVAEKAQRVAIERTSNALYAEKEDVRSRRVIQLQEEAKQQRKDVAFENAQFWKTQQVSDPASMQGKTTTREWDLNRGDRLWISSPARTGDEDPRCGPATLQKFDGEDLNAAQRRRQQGCADVQNWKQQEEERQKVTELQRQDQHRQARHAQLQDEQRVAVADAQKTLRRETSRDNALENQELAAANHKIRSEFKSNSDQLNAVELAAMNSSPFLNERLSTDARKECWKGMSDAELQQIQATQEHQCEDKNAALRKQRAQDVGDARRAAEINRKAFAAARRAEALRSEQSKQLSASLKVQIQDKLHRDAERDRCYRNHVTPEYFAQFQTSHR